MYTQAPHLPTLRSSPKYPGKPWNTSLLSVYLLKEIKKDSPTWHFSRPQNLCLKNEKHLERVLAQLHPGTTADRAALPSRTILEERSWDPRAAKSTVRVKEKDGDLVLSEEKQLLWIS